MDSSPAAAAIRLIACLGGADTNDLYALSAVSRSDAFAWNAYFSFSTVETYELFNIEYLPYCEDPTDFEILAEYVSDAHEDCLAGPLAKDEIKELDKELVTDVDNMDDYLSLMIDRLPDFPELKELEEIQKLEDVTSSTEAAFAMDKTHFELLEHSPCCCTTLFTVELPKKRTAPPTQFFNIADEPAPKVPRPSTKAPRPSSRVPRPSSSAPSTPIMPSMSRSRQAATPEKLPKQTKRSSNDLEWSYQDLEWLESVVPAPNKVVITNANRKKPWILSRPPRRAQSLEPAKWPTPKHDKKPKLNCR
jgi:hypothetical protein